MGKKLLANSKQKQLLVDHLRGVAKYTKELADNLLPDNFPKRDKFLEMCYCAGYFHDLGKCDPSFQKYISSQTQRKSVETEDEEYSSDLRSPKKNSDKAFFYYHQEISLLLTKFIFENLFRNKDKEFCDVVEYGVYWHHAIYNKRPIVKSKIKDLSSLLNNFQIPLQEINNDLERVENFSLEEIEKKLEDKVSPPDYFHELKVEGDEDWEKQAKKTLVRFLVVQADRYISSINNKELKKFLDKPLGESLNDSNEESLNAFLKLKDFNNDKRTKEQSDLAYEMAKCNISICAADPGAGKTSISLLWANECSTSSSGLIFAAPQIKQTEGLWNTIQNDLKRLSGEQEVKQTLELIHSGGKQKSHPPDQGDGGKTFQSNITITTFDRIIQSFLRHDRFEEFTKILNYNLVFDEFHEFLNLTKMVPFLKVILILRKWLGKGNTLFLSGTPDPIVMSFLGGINIFDKEKASFGRSHISPITTDKRKVYLHTSEGSWSNFGNFTPASAVYLNRIEEAQNMYSQYGNNNKLLIHSDFKPEVIQKKLEELFNCFGSESNLNTQRVVFNAKMLQASYDFSFQNVYLTLSHPNDFCQILGRLNRFGDRKDCEIHLKEETNLKIFNKNKKGYKEIYQRFVKFLKNKIKNTNEATHREYLEWWDEFWQDPSNIDIALEEFQDNIKKELETLSEGFYPIRVCKNKNKNNNVTKSSTQSLRGISYFIKVKKIIKYLEFKVPLISNQQKSSHNNVLVFNPPTEDIILNYSKQYMVDEIRGDTSTLKKYAKDYGIKKYQTPQWIIGKQEDMPFILSTSKNSKLDEILSRSNYYHVYNEDLGLIFKGKENEE